MIRHMHASIKRSFHILTQQNHDALNNFPTEWTKLVTTEFNVKCSRKQNTAICPVCLCWQQTRDCGKQGYKIHTVCHLCIFCTRGLLDLLISVTVLPPHATYIYTIYSWAYCGVALLLVTSLVQPHIDILCCLSPRGQLLKCMASVVMGHCHVTVCEDNPSSVASSSYFTSVQSSAEHHFH